MQQIKMRGGIERAAFDSEPNGYIRIRKAGIRARAKRNYSKRARKTAKQAIQKQGIPQMTTITDADLAEALEDEICSARERPDAFIIEENKTHDHDGLQHASPESPIRAPQAPKRPTFRR